MTVQDVEPYRPAAPAVPEERGLSLVPSSPEQVTAALEHWVGGMAASVKGAEYLVDTPMCPDAFWPVPPSTRTKTPKQMLPGEDRDTYLARRRVATLTLGSVVRYGLQLGLPPEVAVQGIFTVGGRMSMYAEQMVALIKSRGHEHRVIERTRERCVVEVRRRGADAWSRFEFTIQDAISAGYVPKQGPNANPGTWPDGKPKEGGGNPKYVTDPATMLYARVSSIACRVEFPDVLRGLVTYEEVQDERAAIPVEVESWVVPRTTAPVTMGEILDRPAPAATPAVPEPEPVKVVDLTPAPNGPVDDKQWRDIGALFVKLAVTGPGQTEKRLAVLSHHVGRPVRGRADLTYSEADHVLHVLHTHGKSAVLEAFQPATTEAPDGVNVETGEIDDAAEIIATSDDYDPTADEGFGQ